MKDFKGPEIKTRKDILRLTTQHERIKKLMRDGKWRTVEEIARITKDPHCSVSAQLRHLRKESFGGFTVLRRPRHGNRERALFEYKVIPAQK